MRARLSIFIASLILLTQPVWAQLSAEEKAAVNKLYKYYNSMGMKSDAAWLKREVQAGRIKFEKLEPGTSANCDIETKIVTINSDNDFSKLRTMIDLGATVAHERTHQDQDPEGWKNEQWREHYWMGNSYEREAWGVGIKKARETAIIFRNRMLKAPSERQRQIEAARLKMALDSWKVLVNDWHAASKRFGKMTLTDSDGLPLTWDDMEKEQKQWMDQVKKTGANSSLIAKPYAGKYRGTLQGPFRDVTFGFQVSQSGEVQGRASGKWIYTKADGKPGQCPFVFSVRGNVTVDGLVKCSLNGTLYPKDFGEWEFSGRLNGNIQGDSASGKWSGSNKHGSMKGTWRANR